MHTFISNNFFDIVTLGAVALVILALLAVVWVVRWGFAGSRFGAVFDAVLYVVGVVGVIVAGKML